MSYRTYILEKELAEVKAERDALLAERQRLEYEEEEHILKHDID